MKQQVANAAAACSARGVVLPWAGRQLPAPQSISQQLLLAPYIPPEPNFALAWMHPSGVGLPEMGCKPRG